MAAERNYISELEAANKEKASLKEEIERLEASLVKVNSKLEEAEALKSHFISNICNELVNPFTSVLALSDNILDVDKENWKKVISMVALIHSEVFHLDFQLKNIFAAAKLEAGELQPEISTVDIESLIGHVIDTFKYDTRHKSINIISEIEGKNNEGKLFFNTDPEKLSLILMNLLSNALKFSYEKSKIYLRASKVFDKLIVEVQDFGKGISSEDENIIFDRFKRVDSGINSVNRGHGLGLSVNKAVLDILDGTISFTSTEKKGTTFIVNIPESKETSTGTSSDVNELFFDEETF
ncbi:MAG: HAMP domain-containing histidine kinase [Bacteroidales bacterium]|nr:HAMP domain-containing histidine kinase [Bacteroidales bacterium]MBN2820163.1 HAMP domain-containing histidine kinase [Bacteroidales bacterium]